jgi:hypothetical protein
MITQEEVKEFFYYKEGSLYTTKPRQGTKKDSKAGKLRLNGYCYVRFKNKWYLEHRLIFLYHHGYLPKIVDHADGSPTNNNIKNLRAATVAQNLWNMKKPCTNTTGVKGVWFDKARNKWYAEFKTNGKKNYVGRYETLEEAKEKLHEARELAQKEFARHE